MIRVCIIAILIGSFGLNAQEKSKEKTHSIPYLEDRLIVNLTLDNWSGLPSTIESNPFRSRGFSFLVMTDQMSSTGNYGFGAGLGFMSQNVHTDAIIIDTGSTTTFIPIPENIDYDVNKLSLNFITAAFELRLRTNENNNGERFKFSTGFVAGYLVQSHTKYEDLDGKLKTYHIEHLNDFTYGIEGRLGYNNFALCGYYSLAAVFKKDAGPEMNTYSVGIAITL